MLFFLLQNIAVLSRFVCLFVFVFYSLTDCQKIKTTKSPNKNNQKKTPKKANKQPHENETKSDLNKTPTHHNLKLTNIQAFQSNPCIMGVGRDTPRSLSNHNPHHKKRTSELCKQ